MGQVIARAGLAAACLMVVAVLVGCTTAGDFCSVAAPIRPTAEAIVAMSDAEVSEALAHNTYGQRACNWKP